MTKALSLQGGPADAAIWLGDYRAALAMAAVLGIEGNFFIKTEKNIPLLLFVKLSWNQLSATLCFVSAAMLSDKSLETGLTAGPAMYVINRLKTAVCLA